MVRRSGLPHAVTGTGGISGRCFHPQASVLQYRQTLRCTLYVSYGGKEKCKQDTQELSKVVSKVVTVLRPAGSRRWKPLRRPRLRRPLTPQATVTASGDRYRLRGRDALRPLPQPRHRPLPPRRAGSGATCRPPPAPAAPRSSPGPALGERAGGRRGTAGRPSSARRRSLLGAASGAVAAGEARWPDWRRPVARARPRTRVASHRSRRRAFHLPRQTSSS